MGSEHEKIEEPGQLQRISNVANRMIKDARPVQREVLDQMLEALQTGGVGARIPIAQRAVEASASATSGALRGAEERLARSGLAGTPMGERILADVGLEGRARTAAIPSGIAGQLAGGAPGFSTNVINSALASLYGVAETDRLVQSFNSQQYASFMKDLKDSLQSLANRGQGGGGNNEDADPGAGSGIDYPGGNDQYYADLTSAYRSPYTEGYGRGGA